MVGRCRLQRALGAPTEGRQPRRISGHWTGSMTMNRKTVDIAVDFAPKAGTFSSRDLMVLDAPISRLLVENGKVAFVWETDDAVRFDGTEQHGRISGTVDIPGLPSSLPVTFTLTRRSDAPPARTYSVQPLSVESTGARLSAQVYVPGTRPPHPALVLLHGSGRSLKAASSYDADFFATLGFEVLIFDKRGVGASTGNYRTATYDDLAADAAACLEVMSRRDSVDRTRIGLWGYSQGAMLLPLVLTRTTIPAFLIAKSPEVEGETAAAAYADRLRVARAGAPAGSGEIVADSHRTVRAMIRAGSDYKTVEAFIRGPGAGLPAALGEGPGSNSRPVRRRRRVCRSREEPVLARQLQRRADHHEAVPRRQSQSEEGVQPGQVAGHRLAAAHRRLLRVRRAVDHRAARRLSGIDISSPVAGRRSRGQRIARSAAGRATPRPPSEVR
jgi:dienelactone hydrolase